MQTATKSEQERAELTTVLASGIFSRAPSLAQVLVYICQKYFEGEANQIKEYNIAVEALGRPPQFDQKRDSIVRVEAHRLRKRLSEYYQGPGSDHEIQIAIPPGQYAPQFLIRKEGQLIPASPGLPLSVVVKEELPLVSVQPARQSIETIQRPEREFSAIAVRHRSIPVWMWTVTLGAALVALAVLGVSWRTRANPEAAASLPRAPIADGEQIRILAGTQQPYTDLFGRTWQPDHYFRGGTAYTVSDHPIFGTRDPRLYLSRREGAFGYDIPLKPGTYEMRLLFAETLFGESNIAGGGETSRLFNVKANGRTLLEGIDVVADGGANTADIRVFKDIQPGRDGVLHLDFEPVINVAFLNGIEITPGAGGGWLRPIRIVARDHAYTDLKGQFWESDRYSRGGQLVVRPHGVNGATDPELYRGERFGNITYVIPVIAKGRYTLKLHFAETWFGPDKPQKGGSGSRLFDVLCNGVALARNLDIYKEAGGGDRALVKIFRGIDAGPQGKLVISLVPGRNYACINAIEVIDESQT